MRPPRASPPLLLMLFGERRWFGLFTWLSLLLLLVLHPSVSVPTQEVILCRRKRTDKANQIETPPPIFAAMEVFD